MGIYTKATSPCNDKPCCCALCSVQVKYDTFITVYMSDCDFYPRVRAAGYQTLESYNTCLEIEHLTVRQPHRLLLQNIQKHPSPV